VALLLALDLPAQPFGIPRARAAVTEVCKALGVAAEVEDNVRLAVTEACTNCVLHAYDGNSDYLTYRVEARLEHGEIVVVVEDWGAGMHGDGDTDAARRDDGAAGRGLRVMEGVTTGLEITSAVDQGTRVEMRFKVT
jgi:serine/threonine-protein kinase RsbW